MSPEADGPEALAGIVDVSRETIERLKVFVALVRKWQKAENLVATGSLASIWRRHVADSAQLATLFQAARSFVDFGSGAGFPGLVVAIATGAHVDLIEANQRKCAFLREAIRATSAPASVHSGRIETVLPEWPNLPAVITARAVAPLEKLLELSETLVGAGARGAFHKGREFQGEIDEASQSWDFDLVIHRSRVDPAGVILEVTRIASKDRIEPPSP
jgi:16S rRNA (guanine527-N7)-methyltransferase